MAATRTARLFRPVKNNRTGRLEKAISPDAIYKIVRRYSADLGFEIGAHALRATAATNALDHKADIAKVQSHSPASAPRNRSLASRPRRRRKGDGDPSQPGLARSRYVCASWSEHRPLRNCAC